MAAIVVFRPFDERGDELLDELEDRTEMSPQETLDDGSRSYSLSAHDVGVDGFDLMLDEIDPEWRQHLSRTAER
jgi:hypothetical protein